MNTRNRYIDYIKVLLCIAVFLYHLKLLEGGYLAVCGFFALSGYLTSKSILNTSDFSLIKFYTKRLIRLYLPMMIVVFISIGAVLLLCDTYWVSLKLETTSILLGYNNFWQISVNADYFAQHSNSPFMHLWYISILLQLTVLLPLYVLPLKKIVKNRGYVIPTIISIFISIVGCLYFVYCSYTKQIMNVYYGTLSRAFSFLFGISVSFITSLFKGKAYKASKLVFWILLFVQLIMFFKVSSDSPYFAIGMILETIIVCISIVCTNYIEIGNKEDGFIQKVINFGSNISYEIYLIQYPLIYIFQFIALDLRKRYVYALILLLTVILSLLMHLCFTKYRNKFVMIIISIMLIFSGYGCVEYITAEDHTEELKQLEEILAKNQELMKMRQDNYEVYVQERDKQWQAALEKLDVTDEDISNGVYLLPITTVGDSVMVGASRRLLEDYPNLYCDAAVSRTGWVVPDILRDLKNKNMLSETIVLGLGTNGDCPASVKDEIMNICGDSEVFWISVTNDNSVHVNDDLKDLCNAYDNAHLIDFAAKAKGHDEYFVADGIHLTSDGIEVYLESIHDELFKVLKHNYEKDKAEAIAKHKVEENNQISFYGDDLLLNLYKNIETNYEICGLKFYSDENMKSFETDFRNSFNNNTLTSKIVFVFDSYEESVDYNSIFDMCKDKTVYIVKTHKSESIDELSYLKNVKIIDFTANLKEHSEYMLFDGKHLSDAGNIALGQFISDSIK